LFCETWNSRNSLVIISISWFSWDYWVNSPLLLLLMRVIMMAREGERADNRINRVSSECPTTTPHVKNWKFDIRSFCSVRGITGKTDPRKRRSQVSDSLVPTTKESGRQFYN
jgi:hypothetical protein